MIVQLNPMLPVYVPEFSMEGYAFLVTEYGMENYFFFTVAVDNGEIWTLDNRRVRFCTNYTASRPTINTARASAFLEKLKNNG